MFYPKKVRQFVERLRNFVLFGLEEVTLIRSIEVSILDDGASSHIPEIKA